MDSTVRPAVYPHPRARRAPAQVRRNIHGRPPRRPSRPSPRNGVYRSSRLQYPPEALQGASPCQGSRGILPVRGGGRGSEAAREADARSGNGGRPRIEGGRRRPQTAAKEGRCAPGRFGSQYAVYVDIKTL